MSEITLRSHAKGTHKLFKIVFGSEVVIALKPRSVP